MYLHLAWHGIASHCMHAATRQPLAPHFRPPCPYHAWLPRGQPGYLTSNNITELVSSASHHVCQPTIYTFHLLHIPLPMSSLLPTTFHLLSDRVSLYGTQLSSFPFLVTRGPRGPCHVMLDISMRGTRWNIRTLPNTRQPL
jgi:hypothetical protein